MRHAADAPADMPMPGDEPLDAEPLPDEAPPSDGDPFGAPDDDADATGPPGRRWRVPAIVLGAVGALVFLFSVYVVLVWNGNLAAGASWVTDVGLNAWIAWFSAALALLLVGQLALYVVARVAGPEEEPLVQPEATGAPLVEYVVRCHACQGEYAVKDEGVRPLAITCPHCATTVEATGPLAAQFDVVSSEQRMKLLCTHCGGVFDVPHSTERPLHFACPSCGRAGVLKDPAPEVPMLEELPGVPANLPHTGERIEFLEGIGPVYAGRLEQLGVSHTDDLLACDPVSLAQLLNEPEGMVRSWLAMADLVRIQGVGKQYAEVLVRVGVASIDDLVTRDPKAVAAAIAEDAASVDVTIQGNPVTEKMVRGWIRAAKAWEKAHGKVAQTKPSRRKAKPKRKRATTA